MRYLLIPILLLSSSTSSASDHSISITIKPSASIVGTVSFNIHSDQSVTVLVYESVTKITETPLSIDDKTVVRVSQLSEWVFDEFTSLKDYFQFPEYKQGSAIAITQDRVTKSISTHRYSERLISLINLIKGHLPTRFQPQLDKK